jgi:hypothetical protein
MFGLTIPNHNVWPNNFDIFLLVELELVNDTMHISFQQNSIAWFKRNKQEARSNIVQLNDHKKLLFFFKSIGDMS